ncbi:MAG: class I SAM-dependent methyltransferase, partial [Chloroflexota bacterium]
EIGCGTGKNLKPLAQAYPDAEVVGLDLSTDMLNVAQKTLAPFGDRVRFIQQRYDQPLHLQGEPLYDLILCSYSLTMINPGWDTVIESAVQDLEVGGQLAMTDFHDSRFNWYKRWMGTNHVRMDSHLLPKLQSLLKTEVAEVKSAYGFVWEYVVFIGTRE